jgi:3-oxoacyl-(acyl-carrier-protein) synthase
VACDILQANLPRRVDYVLSNSFGFGGNNCVLVFARAG